MNTANISTAQHAKCHAIIHGAGAACGLVFRSVTAPSSRRSKSA